MSEYDLRPLFPYAGHEFGTPDGAWLCRLAEVSDSRPESDRLSWYLVFEHGTGWSGPNPGVRKLELVTSAGHLIATGFPAETESRLTNWILTDEQDGRLEWLEL